MGIIKLLLFPVALLFGFAVFVRNKLFDWRVLKSRVYNFPLISVGNLSVGGTGKTPHVEYLVNILQDKYKVSILSRGYKRKTKGFILADPSSLEEEIGDEPLQFVKKYHSVQVAVDARRARGIKLLREAIPDLDLIILDDGYQHRYVKPGLSILLTDYHNLYMEDYLLPAGTLREPRKNVKRADIIIITKTPKVLSPLTTRRILSMMNPRPCQQVFFSYISYDTPKSLPLNDNNFTPKSRYSCILLVTGIANPYPLQEHLGNICHEIIPMEFPDHHRYDLNDIKNIADSFHNIFASDKVIFTTEKDAMRLHRPEFADVLNDLPVFYIPITVKFHQVDKENIDKLILNYVGKYKKYRSKD